MKFRSTLYLAAIGAALAAYLIFYDRYQKASNEIEVGKVVEVDRDKINSVSIKNAEAKIELRKHDDGQWFLEESVKDRADANVIAQLFTGVETLHSEDTVPLGKEKEQQLKEFGISDSNTKARFTGSGKPVELIFGKDTAVKGKTYVYVEGASQIYAVGDELKNQLSKKPDEFRDRKLTDLTTQKITKLQITSAAGELELAKKNNHWSIVKPMVARGDDSKINDLISQATVAHIDQFLSDPNLANYGLSEPRGTLTLTVEGSDKPVVLQIGGSPKEEKDKEKVYVKLSTRDAVVLVPKTIENALNTKPNDLRDHNLLRVESDIVDRINVEAGSDKLVLARKGESWVRKDGDKEAPINVAAATRLLSDLQGAQVYDFVSDVAADLPKYGLDQPAAKVTFSSFASENTAETKAGERPIVQVLFGKAVEGRDAQIYARLDTEPFIVTIARNILESVPKSAIELQDLAITSFKPEELSTLEVGVGTQPSIGLERQKDQTWKLTKGEGNVNQANIISLANALSGLRAVRWTGPVKPEQGFEHPVAVVGYISMKGDQKAPGKLTLGAMSPEGLTFAQAEGMNGVFQLSRPDFDALVAPLTDKQVPLATSVTSPPVGVPGIFPPAAEPGGPAPGPMPLPAPAPELPAAAPAPAPVQAPMPAPAPEVTAPAPMPAPIPAPSPAPAPAPAPAPVPAPETAVPPAATSPVPTLPAAPASPAPPATNPPIESVPPALPVPPATVTPAPPAAEVPAPATPAAPPAPSEPTPAPAPPAPPAQ